MEMNPPLVITGGRLRIGEGLGQVDVATAHLARAGAADDDLMQVNRLVEGAKRLPAGGVGLHAQGGAQVKLA